MATGGAGRHWARHGDPEISRRPVRSSPAPGGGARGHV